MVSTAPRFVDSPLRSGVVLLTRRLSEVLRTAAPPLLFGVRLWASVSIALYAAFWLELDNPYWAGTSAAIVCQVQLGASLRKGWFRMIGTVIGAAMSMVLVACFPQNRVLFLGALAVWGAGSAFAATLLRNYASYAAALAGYTAAIIAGDLLGTVGGIDANAALLLAISRATEICLGIVCAGVVLAGTDFGGARRRLATHFADLLIGIIGDFTRTLAMVGHEFVDTRSVRREFVRHIVDLIPVIDQALGESATIRYHSLVLQSAVDGLFRSLSGWGAIAHHLEGLSAGETRQEAAAVLQNLPVQLRSTSQRGAMEHWIGNPVALHRVCELTVERLVALPAVTPSMRLIADKTAEIISGVANALNGLSLLTADPARPRALRGSMHMRVPDWLPALVNAGRAFVTIGTVAMVWIITAWPGGASAITFAAIFVLVLAPRAEQAYRAVLSLIAGIILDLIITSTVAFAVLPGLGIATFAGFSLVLAFCLVPIGALLARADPRQITVFTGMAALFMPILQPGNPMTYDPQTFYNVGLAIVCGAGSAALSFRLMPPLSPAFRARRLLALTLRDLRRFAMGHYQYEWAGLVYGRLSAMPDQATPLQHAQLLAALSAGNEITNLQNAARRFGLCAELRTALAVLSEGHSEQAIARLSRLDGRFAAHAADGSEVAAVLLARSSILVLSEALATYPAYFDAGATG